MIASDLRRRVAWLIGIRAIISTLLLGGAIVAQVTSPGSFPVNPFFFLVALTYGLTIAYASTLRFVDRYHWLVDIQLALATRRPPRRNRTTLAATIGST